MSIDEINLRYKLLHNPTAMGESRKLSHLQKLRMDLVRTHVNQPRNYDLLNQRISNFNTFLKADLGLEDIYSITFSDESADSFKDMTLSPYSGSCSSIASSFIQELSDQVDFEVVIHGSHGDSTVTKYSDFDVSIFIDPLRLLDSDFKFSRSLTAINRRIKKIDFDSHHGAFVFVKNDINFYPESFMPLSALSSGVSNFDNLKVSVRKDHDLGFISMVDAYTALKKFISVGCCNPHHLKLILSTYFIFLVIHDQFVTGEYGDKKSVLKKLKSIGDVGDNEVLIKASNIRLNFPNTLNQNLFCSSGFLKDISKHIDNKFSSTSVGLLDEKLSEYIK